MIAVFNHGFVFAKSGGFEFLGEKRESNSFRELVKEPRPEWVMAEERFEGGRGAKLGAWTDDRAWVGVYQ